MFVEHTDWDSFKGFVNAKYLLIQFLEDPSSYTLFAFDGSFGIKTKILKIDDQGANLTSAERTDFETNFKANANKTISPTDSDGSNLARTKITRSGWSYQLHAIEFSTGKRTIDHSKSVAGVDIGFATMKCYDADNVEITDDSLLATTCVKTVLSWEATHDLDLIGAMFYQATIPGTDVRMWTVGVPDVPAIYGGSKAFVQGGMNLKFLGTGNVMKVDGRVPKALSYSATYHTNKIQMTFKHDVGVSHPMMLVFEFFKA